MTFVPPPQKKMTSASPSKNKRTPFRHALSLLSFAPAALVNAPVRSPAGEFILALHTWTMRSQDFSSLRTAHHKLLLRIIGFRRKDRIGYRPLSYREVLERTGSERIETTIRKRQLGFAGTLVRQGDSRLSKRVMFGRLAVQGPKRGGRPATSWVDCLQKNLEAFGAVPLKGKGRKWVAFGVVVKDGRDWMTAAKNMGKWHRGVERGAEALDSAWRREDLRQSSVQL